MKREYDPGVLFVVLVVIAAMLWWCVKFYDYYTKFLG